MFFEYFVFFIGTVAVFLGVVVCLALPSNLTKKIIAYCAGSTAIISLLFYGIGHGYECVQGKYDIITAILQASVDTLKVFTGSSNWNVIYNATLGLFKESSIHIFIEILFWITNLSGIFVSASAIIVSFGSGIIKTFKIGLLKWHNISIIYGVNENSISFGRELIKENDDSIVFVDKYIDGKHMDVLKNMGVIVRSDVDAINGNIKFLKSIGLKPGKRKLTIYTLNQLTVVNQEYAKNISESLKKLKLNKDQTSLTILCYGDTVKVSDYEFGNVFAINEAEMVARLLIMNYPPYKLINFNASGEATSDFHAIIIGIGKIGQAALKQLVMNSQFNGCKSRYDIFAPDYTQRMGHIKQESSYMFERYNINMHEYDGRSIQMYDFLREKSNSVNYIVICTGDDKVNNEIAEDLQSFLKTLCKKIQILICSYTGVYQQFGVNNDYNLNYDINVKSNNIYVPKILCTNELDRMAIRLNHLYNEKKGEELENWAKCDYFERMSNRSSVDFYDALLFSVNENINNIRYKWEKFGIADDTSIDYYSTKKNIINMAINEHNRWVAFHCCMGYRLMSSDEFEKRAQEYLNIKKINNNASYKIRKNEINRTHACLVEWNELKTFSKIEEEYTKMYNENKDYQMQNIKSIMYMIEIMQTIDN